MNSEDINPTAETADDTPPPRREWFTVIHPEGFSVVKNHEEERISLETLQEAVEGSKVITIVHSIIDPIAMWMDENNVDCFADDNGMIEGSPLNPIASMLMGHEIVGNVIFCCHDDEGYNIPMTEELNDRLQTLIRFTDFYLTHVSPADFEDEDETED